MHNSKSTNIFLVWPLHVSLLLLLLNDFALKHAYPGIITGKLSDFAGIFLLTLILRHWLPRHPARITSGISLAFVYWKSTWSQPLIDWVNTLSPVQFGRTVDYTDLLALLIIPLAQRVYDTRHQFMVFPQHTRILKIPVMLLTVFAITATSALTPHHEYTIRKSAETAQIDPVKAAQIIQQVAEQNKLNCVQCDVAARNGEFSDEEITLRYSLSQNNRGVLFQITGQPGGIFFGSGSWERMETIKRQLQNTLGTQFRGMEFVMQLPGY